MEEVWEDIALPSLQTTTRTSLPTWQDLFPRTNNDNNRSSSEDQEIVQQSQQGVTKLSLSSSCSAFNRVNIIPNSVVTCNNKSHFFVGCGPFMSSLNASQCSHLDASGPSCSMSNSACKKVVVRENHQSGSHSDDVKRKRMIKNRESAARSRARKQAYIYELESEKDHLLKENAWLKRQQERLMEASEVPKKSSLRRTLTASF